jgi:hypothetical protein
MADGDIENWLQQSQWVIQGTVEQTRAATLKGLPVSEHTLVLRVDEILHGPQQFNDHRGRQITLYSGRSEGLKPGQRAVFFTRSWLYGESLAVAEVGRLEGGAATMRVEIAAANQRIADQRLVERINRAELVIAGTVMETRPLPPQAGRRRIETEHDPDWWEAIIRVNSVEKGSVPEGVIVILFANSMDELWIDSPKFRNGQEGIWILQRDQTEKGWPVLRVPGRTALDPLDFQAIQQLERIRQLIRPR